MLGLDIHFEPEKINRPSPLLTLISKCLPIYFYLLLSTYVYNSPMRLVYEIEMLRGKIAQIELRSEDITGSVNLKGSADLIETAFWARSVLEIFEHVKFKKYGHTLNKSIRTVSIVPDPDHPERDKTIYNHHNITLNRLLNTIVHFRYFQSPLNADGKKTLEVESDRNTIRRVYFSDFVKALKSLVIEKKLIALAICDFIEHKMAKILSKSPNDLTDMDIFCYMNLDWVLSDFLKDEIKLKLRIMKEVFGIVNVPSETLCDLKFFINGTTGDKLNIVFSPNWAE